MPQSLPLADTLGLSVALDALALALQTTGMPMHDDAELDGRLASLRAAGRANNVPNASPETTLLLRRLIVWQRPAQILEIGMATGYSTLQMARTARTVGACITTIDFSRPIYEEGCRNIATLGFADCVTPMFGSALAVLPGLPRGYFDMVFIDGQKRQTLDLFLGVVPHCQGSVPIVIDDALRFHAKMAAFYDWLDARRHPYRLIPTEPGDALLLTLTPL